MRSPLRAVRLLPTVLLAALLLAPAAAALPWPVEPPVHLPVFGPGCPQPTYVPTPVGTAQVRPCALSYIDTYWQHAFGLSGSIVRFDTADGDQLVIVYHEIWQSQSPPTGDQQTFAGNVVYADGDVDALSNVFLYQNHSPDRTLTYAGTQARLQGAFLHVIAWQEDHVSGVDSSNVLVFLTMDGSTVAYAHLRQASNGGPCTMTLETRGVGGSGVQVLPCPAPLPRVQKFPDLVLLPWNEQVPPL